MYEENDEAHLLSIFPAEVWKLILDSVIDPDVLISCSEATALFKTLLESKKPVYLFPQVLQVLDKYSYLKDDPKLVRSCRQVCRSWCFSLDRFLETRPHHSKPNINDFSQRCFPSKDASFGTFARFYLSSHANLLEMENTIVSEFSSPFYREHNPFPGRHLEIVEHNWCSEAITQRYREATERILERVGHHVWHLRICIFLKPVNCWYRVTQRFLSLLPNLKTLYLGHNAVRQERNMQTQYKLLYERYCESIEEQADGPLPFPNFPNLNLLCLQDLPHTAVRAVLEANPHIRSLEMVPMGSIHWLPRVNHYEAMSLVGRNLSSLSLTIVRPEDVRNLKNSWKLEHLRLDCTMLPNPICHWSLVWEKVERYSKTLKELAVNMLFDDCAEKAATVITATLAPVKLPKLKKLWVSLPKDCSLDFLLGFKSLEFLSLRISPTICVDLVGVVLPGKIQPKINNAKDLLFCNIWSKMPTLKVIQLWDPDKNAFMEYKRVLPQRGLDRLTEALSLRP